MASSFRIAGFVALSALALPVTAGAAVLEGRAVLPALTFAPGPTSGQFSGGGNGIVAPFQDAQPVQGFSGLLRGPVPGTYLTLVDNGFGAKGNSADALLRAYGIRPDFTTGAITPVDVTTGAALGAFGTGSFVQFRDPNGLAGFATVASGATYPGSAIPVDQAIRSGRLLTGADFDPESIRRVADGTFYVGEEFGPYLLHFDATGVLLEAPIPVPNALGFGSNPLVQSPQSPAVTSGGLPPLATPNLPGSKGFEGLALNASGTRLLGLLEGPLNDDPNRSRLLINEFDLATRAFTGRVFQYRMEDPANAIGDLTALSDTEFLVIERDGGQGAAARFKRIYRIDLANVGADGFVRKTLVADLLNIRDPGSLGGNGTVNGVFTFPFTTIESVLPIDNQTLLVTNDNNFPFSSGRTPGQADDNEFIRIRLDEPLLVPEPGSVLLVAAGLAAMLGVSRPRSRRRG